MIKKFKIFEKFDPNDPFGEEVYIDDIENIIRDKKIIYNQEFTDFLIDNNAYGNYVKSIVLKRGIPMSIPSINEYIKSRVPRLRDDNIINDTVIWSQTEQGTHYWYDLHNLWWYRKKF